MAEIKLPARCKFLVNWRGNRAGDVPTLTTEKELAAAIELAKEGVCEIGGYTPPVPETPAPAMPETPEAVPETVEAVPETVEAVPETEKPKRRRKRKSDD